VTSAWTIACLRLSASTSRPIALTASRVNAAFHPQDDILDISLVAERLIGTVIHNLSCGQKGAMEESHKRLKMPSTKFFIAPPVTMSKYPEEVSP
jgi:hypothetical protein